MKLLVAWLFIASTTLAATPSINDAPLEWLIVKTIQLKSFEDNYDHNHDVDHHDHHKKDKIIEEIFNTVEYDMDSDELVFSSNKKTHQLRKNLLKYLSANITEGRGSDHLYRRWRREKTKKRLKMKEVSSVPQGFYYFNHVHTNYSQDNASLKLLKISPEKTFDIIESFLKKRNSKAAVAFTDHHQTNAYDDTLHMTNSRITTLRSVEWGGYTHMNLVGIKDNWDLLKLGRTFREEESIIKSRSSGGFRIANHINKSHVFPYSKWLDVDGVEVWNTIVENAPFTIFKINKMDNRGALKQWAESLKHGMRKTAVAGSDFHFITPCLRDKTLHYPANYIDHDNISDAKEMLYKGRVSILTQPYSPKLILRAKFDNMNNWARMGDEIQGKGDLSVELFADFSDSHKLLKGVCYNSIVTFSKLLTFWKKRKWELRFYNLEGKLITKRRVYPKKFGKNKNLKATFKTKISGQDVVRAELWAVNSKTKNVDLLGMTNPIYINREAP